MKIQDNGEDGESEFRPKHYLYLGANLLINLHRGPGVDESWCINADSLGAESH